MSRERKEPPRREKRTPRQPAKANRASGPKPVRHPLFGDIPMVEVVEQVFDRTFTRWDYDRDYQPALPPGAVRGNPHQQHFCPMCHVPRYFYVDQERNCVECGRDFVFSGSEQRFWFEQLHFHFSSVPIRCLDCRRTVRTSLTLVRALERAKAALEENPDDPVRLLALAEAVVRLREPTGKGDLNEAIRRARSVGRSPAATVGNLAEAAFWEGKAHALAGRGARARELLTSALPRLGSSRRGRTFLAEAKWLLASMD